MRCFFVVTRTGIDRLLRLKACILSAWLTPSPLLAKNNPPDCFPNAKTLSGSIFKTICKEKNNSPTWGLLSVVTRTGIEPVLPP